MKFDIIIGNPPYQEQKPGNSKTTPIWHNFVNKSIDIINDNGYIALVHPIGWRDVSGKYKSLQEKMLKNNLIYLSMNDIESGKKMFGASTPFDYYLLQKCEYSGKTKINDIHGDDVIYDLSNVEFIPNYDIEFVYSFLAKNNEERIEVLYDMIYHHQRDYIIDDITQYPIAYSVKSTGLNKKYSTENRGHFGIPKIMLSNGASQGFYNDRIGEYGMSEFTYGIINNDLDSICRAFENPEFKRLTYATKFIGTQGSPLINRRILELFRKDFWKEFIEND